MTKLFDTPAKRLFSLNPFKNLKLPLGEMSFGKDFVNETRGDIYPITGKSGDICEKVSGGKYSFSSENGSVARLVGRHYPYVTYELTLQELCGTAGFVIDAPCGKTGIFVNKRGQKLCLSIEGNEQSVCAEMPKGDITLIVTCRTQNFDVYLKYDGYPQYVYTFTDKNFENIDREDVFCDAVASVYFSGSGVCRNASFYIDCGISQADLRPVRYENGDIITENGKVFITATLRMQEQCIEGVLSWVPGTADFELVGALFFNTGDGVWGNDVATSLMFDRNASLWRLWVCSFSHGHVLGYSEFDGDVRFGVNVVDIELLEELPDDADVTQFGGKSGDEDPDFIYDKKSGKWYMSVCRVCEGDDGRGYRYFFYESDNPHTGYKYIGNTKSGQDTGGSILCLDGEYVFVCGSCFDRRADYRVYRLGDFSDYKSMKFNYDDGGFRGWGTIIPCKRGSRTKYFHLTFDRAGGSDYTWSYGNLYCFEVGGI